MHKYTVPESIRARVIRLQGKPFALDSIEAAYTALVVVDMQNYYVAEGFPNESPSARAIVPCINRLAAELRAAGGRVVWMPDLPETEIEYGIEDLGEAVKVTVGEYHGAAHEQVKDKFAEASRDGWALILSGIKTILETGKPLPPIRPKPPK